MYKKIIALFIVIATVFSIAACSVKVISGEEKGNETDNNENTELKFSFDYSVFKGKTVVTVGAGGTPDVVFRYVLAKNGIGINEEGENSSDKVTIDYANDASVVIQKIKNGEAAYAVLGEPAATTVKARTDKRIVLDLQQAFTAVEPDVNFVQAGLFATSKVTSHSAYLNALIDKLGENKDFIYSNKSSLKELFGAKESSLKSIDFTDEILNRCNIGMKKAGEVKNDVVAFLNTVKEFNASQIGGKLPGDDFYYDFTSANSSDYAKTQFTIGVVDGAPSLAVANILDGFTYSDGDKTIKTKVELVSSAQNIQAGLLNGTYDMAIAPLNMASALYNAKPELGIKLLSVNIFGCLYAVG